MPFMRDRVEEWKDQMRAEGRVRKVSPERMAAFYKRHDKEMKRFVADFKMKQHLSAIEAQKHVLT